MEKQIKKRIEELSLRNKENLKRIKDDIELEDFYLIRNITDDDILHEYI